MSTWEHLRSFFQHNRAISPMPLTPEQRRASDMVLSALIEFFPEKVKFSLSLPPSDQNCCKSPIDQMNQSAATENKHTSHKVKIFHFSDLGTGKPPAPVCKSLERMAKKESGPQVATGCSRQIKGLNWAQLKWTNWRRPLATSYIKLFMFQNPATAMAEISTRVTNVQIFNRSDSCPSLEGWALNIGAFSRNNTIIIFNQPRINKTFVAGWVRKQKLLRVQQIAVIHFSELAKWLKLPLQRETHWETH